MINGLDEKVYREMVKNEWPKHGLEFMKNVLISSFSHTVNFFDEFDCFHMHKEKLMLSVRGLSVLQKHALF